MKLAYKTLMLLLASLRFKGLRHLVFVEKAFLLTECQMKPWADSFYFSVFLFSLQIYCDISSPLFHCKTPERLTAINIQIPVQSKSA